MNIVRHLVASGVALVLLTACGGGDDRAAETTSFASAHAPSPVAQVRLEGCVLDDHDRPQAEGVHAFGADGRLLATATSRADGVFVMTVPAGQALSVGLDAPGHEALSLTTTDGNLSVSACLRANRA
jgi:hypothetical protein